MGLAESMPKVLGASYHFSDSCIGMFDAERFRGRLQHAGLSQSELARRVGVSQSSIQKLASGNGYGSKHLHRIARELGTTPAFLTGETDDPTAEAPDAPDLSADEQRLLEIFRSLPKEDRNALKRMVERMAGPDDGPAT